MIKVFIVEDEVPALIRMQDLIQGSSFDIQICGEAALGREAIRKINALQPDVIFLDIQLPDINGFEILQHLKCNPFIIFTTAYEEFALKAFEFHSIDYLVKPIDQSRFDLSIQKLKNLQVKSTNAALQNMDEWAKSLRPQKGTTLPVKDRDRIILLNFDDIVYFQAEDKYVNVALQNGTKYLLNKSLSKLELELPIHFHRVHRSYIVNQHFVFELERYFKGRFVLKMNDQKGTAIKTGEMFHSKIKEVFGL
jgi:two-component system LytT family response regulator